MLKKYGAALLLMAFAGPLACKHTDNKSGEGSKGPASAQTAKNADDNEAVFFPETEMEGEATQALCTAPESITGIAHPWRDPSKPGYDQGESPSCYFCTIVNLNIAKFNIDPTVCMRRCLVGKGYIDGWRGNRRNTDPAKENEDDYTAAVRDCKKTCMEAALPGKTFSLADTGPLPCPQLKVLVEGAGTGAGVEFRVGLSTVTHIVKASTVTCPPPGVNMTINVLDSNGAVTGAIVVGPNGKVITNGGTTVPVGSTYSGTTTETSANR